MAGNFEQTKNDLQRTFREILRVVLYRRWSFLVPFCIAATAVFVSSHNIPRVYQAHTIFERRNTIPIAKVLEPRGPESIDYMRKSLAQDMLSPEALVRVADRMGLSHDLPRDAGGHVTQSGQRQLEALANRFSGMLSHKVLDSGPDLDRIQISATGSDPQEVVELANAVREHYFEFIRMKFLGTLRDAQGFYDSEIEETLRRITEFEGKLDSIRRENPYVTPQSRATLDADLRYHKNEHDKVSRRIEELQRNIAVMVERLQDMPVTKLIQPQAPHRDLMLLDDEMSMEAERRRLRQQILDLQNQMMQLRIDKQMKDPHPTMQALIRREDQLNKDLHYLDEKLANTHNSYTEDPAEAAVKQSDRQQVEYELAANRQVLTVAENELREVEQAIKVLEDQRESSKAMWPEYQRFTDEVTKVQAELDELRHNHRQIARVLDIDAKDQGIEFATVKEASTTRRPILPNSRTILTLALGVGLAFGAAAVFLREFFDHTFHTSNAVSFALGVQILDGIDEIVLPADRRRMLIRRLVALPLACVFVGTLAVSGILAYLSLENPPRYKVIRDQAAAFWQDLRAAG